ncbi:PD-(D/E)XK nuclease family protein [Leucobacter sp. cx-169]|uniref:RecB family exonuclease n=1 Tax=Leucobacter sp. cx-169 TaxID=2770549 RepID=UPI00165D3549|nr:PD-(D/E)XK nuclease family protein [Leucobacter sp. cx-169]MBC9927328.1 PD-(D/E)XK nuclease family protein [Leucobacter sp. cx-169]
MSEPFQARKPKSVKGMRFIEQSPGSYALSVSAEQAKNADRELLSHSVAEAVEQCPASHAAKCNLPRHEHPFDANVLGSGSHDILEHFYLLPPAKRLEDEFRRLADEVSERKWSESKLVDQFPQTLEANRELRAEWHDTVLNWAMRIVLLENPQDVDVVGTEVELKGLLTSNGVSSTGKIDRVRRLPDGSFGSDDYKFGVWKGVPNPKFHDGYKAQQHLYRDLYVTNFGVPVDSLRIIYPREPIIRDLDIVESEQQATLDGFKKTRAKLTGLVKAKLFPATPGGLCSWCDLARSCPVANIPVPANAVGTRWKPLEVALEKAVKADASARTKRSADELGIHVITSLGTDLGVLDDSRFHSEAPTFLIAPNERGVDVVREATAEEVAAAQTPAETETPPPAPVSEAPRITEVESLSPFERLKMSSTRAPRPEARMDQETVGVELNLMSHAARNSSDLATFALRTLRYNAQPLTATSLNGFASVLGTITRRVEKIVSGNQSLNLGAASRAVYSVKSAVDTITPVFGGTEDDWANWVQRIETLAVSLMMTAEAIWNQDSLEHTLIYPQPGGPATLAQLFTPTSSAANAALATA